METDGEARRLFETYNEQGPNPWKTFDGREVPRWDHIDDQVRAKWMAVARAAHHRGARRQDEEDEDEADNETNRTHGTEEVTGKADDPREAH